MPAFSGGKGSGRGFGGSGFARTDLSGSSLGASGVAGLIERVPQMLREGGGFFV
jgi:hypothetical protein